jgi:hypothetical protein
MRQSSSAGPPCKIVAFPIGFAQPKPETSVCWSDPPELVLARLRALHGPEWWLS